MTERTFRRLDQPSILPILFHPRRNVSAPPEGASSRTVRFTMGDGTEIGGRLHLAATNAPALLFFHGNGEIATDYDSLAPVYRGLGLTLLVVDYRGYGISQGQPTVAHLMSDALAVYRKARAETGLAPSRWFVMGRSLGSAAALEVARAAGPEVDGLILESGFAETGPLAKTLGGAVPPDFDEARDGMGNEEKIKGVKVPTLILHGEADRLVPAGNARTLYTNSGAAYKRLVLIPGAGHNDLLAVGADSYFKAIKELVETSR